MASHNDITGDALVSKRNNDNYRNNYDAIFGKKKKVAVDAGSEERILQNADVQDTAPHKADNT